MNAVRPYTNADRAAVREICWETADKGFPDQEVVADVLTRYFTDLNPSASWVAEVDGRVAGYLTGCFNTRRYIGAMIWRVMPAALGKALWHGSIWHRFVWRIPPSTSFNRRQVLRDYPAHLHLNLREGYRGRGIGPALLAAFVGQAKQAGVPGIHLGVMENNRGGRHFFEKAGFTELGREARWGGGTTIIYGQRLFP